MSDVSLVDWIQKLFGVTEEGVIWCTFGAAAAAAMGKDHGINNATWEREMISSFV